MAKQKISGYYNLTLHENGKVADRDYAQDTHGNWYTRSPKSTVSKAWRELTGERPRYTANDEVFIYVEGKGDVKLTYVAKNVELPEPALHDDLDFDADLDFSIEEPAMTLPAETSMTETEAREKHAQLKSLHSVARALLLEIRDRKGYLALGFSSFEEYGEQEWGYTRTYINRLADAEVIQKSISVPIGTKEIPESQLRELGKIPEALRAEIYQQAQAEAEAQNKEVTAKLIREKAEAESLKTQAEVALYNKELDLNDKLKQAESEKQHLLEDLTDTKSALNLAITNIEEEVKQGIEERLPEITEQAEATAKAKLEMTYRDEIAIHQENIDSLKAELNSNTYTFEELDKKRDELHLAEQALADYNTQLSDLEQQIADRHNAIQTDDDINNGYCNVLDNLVWGIAATLSQLDIHIEDGKVTALCPLTNTTLQKVDKAIAKLDDTMQILTLLLRTKTTS